VTGVMGAASQRTTDRISSFQSPRRNPFYLMRPHLGGDCGTRTSRVAVIHIAVTVRGSVSSLTAGLKGSPMGCCRSLCRLVLQWLAGDILADPRSDGELFNDTKLYGLCTFCATPRTTNRDGRAKVGTEAVICPNDACPAMQAILVEPRDGL
jgi:hypothetical protein